MPESNQIASHCRQVLTVRLSTDDLDRTGLSSSAPWRAASETWSISETWALMEEGGPSCAAVREKCAGEAYRAMLFGRVD